MIWQADPNFNTDTPSWDAFPDYLDALQTSTLAFPGQVALVHGDGHYFKMDKPLNRPNARLPSGGDWIPSAATFALDKS